MAYMGPKGSIPTHRGWVHPKTGELLKRQKLTSEFIAEWHGATAPVPAPAPAPEPVVQTLHEAPVVEETPVAEPTYNFFAGRDVE